MKTFRLTAAAVLLVVSTAVSNAQMGRVRDSEYFPRNEVYVQYGTPSIIELTTILNSEYRSEGYDGDSRNHKFSGIAAVGYSFFVHPRVSVGLDFGYGYGSADMYITDSDAAPVTSPYQQLFCPCIGFLYLLAAGSYGVLGSLVSGCELSG